MIRKKLGRAGVAAVALVLVLGTFAATASATRFTPGSPGLGDPFFPNAGNGGYDVKHYTLDLDFDPATDQLVGKATIVAESKAVLRARLSEPAPVVLVSWIVVERVKAPLVSSRAAAIVPV